MRIDVMSFQLATIVMTVVSLITVKIAEINMIKKIKAIEIGVMVDDKEVALEDVPPFILEHMEALVNMNIHHIQLTCVVIKGYLTFIGIVFNLLCFILY